MKRVFHGILLALGLLVSASSAQACCLWPFGGWYGAGYPSFGYPGYGYGYGYTAGYPMFGAPVYSASYGGACCAPSCCCDPCCGGSCASGSCGASTTNSNSLKPTTDPNFRDRDSSDYDNTDDSLRNRRLQPENPVDEAPLNRRGGQDPVQPEKDDFRGADDPNGQPGEMFQNKPPMPELKDLPPANENEPAKEDSFLPAEPQAGVPGRSVIAEQSSRMDEVIQPRRLASRSVPSRRSVTTVAGSKQDTAVPVRWISLPAPEGNVRL
ncbi:MAG: hypothetical protein U0996_00915 [Planctomycetaceae bacterium]